MPAAAVIPALIAYIKVVAVKKLVVGSREGLRWWRGTETGLQWSQAVCTALAVSNGGGAVRRALTKAGAALGGEKPSHRCP